MFWRTHGPKKRLFAHKSYPGAGPKTCPHKGDHRYLSFLLCTPDCPKNSPFGTCTFIPSSHVNSSRCPCCGNERNCSRLDSNEGQKKSQKASENSKNELRLRGVPTDIKNLKNVWCGPPPDVIRSRRGLLRSVGWPEK